MNLNDLFNAIDLATALTIIAALLFIAVFRKEIRSFKKDKKTARNH